MRRYGARGFTIIEALVIIAIGCILMAILFPVFARTRGCYLRPCISNLKQVGTATAMYLQDYDDAFLWNPAPGGLPASHSPSASRPGECARQPRTSFVVLLYPYLKDTRAFKCSNYAGYDIRLHLGYRRSLMRASDGLASAGVAPPAGTTWVQRIGYGFNEVLIGDPCRPRAADSLQHAPAEVALLADAEEPWASTGGVWVQKDGRWSRYWASEPGEMLRHPMGQRDEKGRNFVFVDGHAKTLRPMLSSGEGKREQGYYPEAKLE